MRQRPLAATGASSYAARAPPRRRDPPRRHDRMRTIGATLSSTLGRSVARSEPRTTMSTRRDRVVAVAATASAETSGPMTGPDRHERRVPASSGRPSRLRLGTERVIGATSAELGFALHREPPALAPVRQRGELATQAIDPSPHRAEAVEDRRVRQTEMLEHARATAVASAAGLRVVATVPGATRRLATASIDVPAMPPSRYSSSAAATMRARVSPWRSARLPRRYGRVT